MSGEGHFLIHRLLSTCCVPTWQKGQENSLSSVSFFFCKCVYLLSFFFNLAALGIS